MTKVRLFISHANADKPLVQTFVDLLEGGVGVPPKDIFCSSLKGQGITPGSEFKESIRESLDEATCVIALISPNFYGSPFCMCELGGVWLQSKSFLPVLVPPHGYADLKAVLEGIQALQLETTADLDELRDELGTRLDMDVLDTPRWNERKELFLKRLPSLIQGLPNETPVERAAYVKLTEQLQEYRASYHQLEEQIGAQQEIIAKLRSAKDAKEADAIIHAASPIPGEFEALTASAREALRALPSCVREALYYRERGEDLYRSRSDEWKVVQSPLEYGQLKLNGNETGVLPDLDDPKVNSAARTVDDLADWIAGASGEFFEWYDTENDGERADIQLRQFWEDNLWL